MGQAEDSLIPAHAPEKESNNVMSLTGTASAAWKGRRFPILPTFMPAPVASPKMGRVLPVLFQSIVRRTSAPPAGKRGPGGENYAPCSCNGRNGDFTGGASGMLTRNRTARAPSFGRDL